MSAVEVARAKGVTFRRIRRDEHGNCVEATLPSLIKRGEVMAYMLAPTEEEAARMAVEYLSQAKPRRRIK